MSCLLQICSMIALMFWIETTQSIPLFQGFSINKGFELKLHPFEFKPLSIFKEKWSPFGRIGIRKGIHKREISPPRMPAPVFEEVLEDKPLDDREENIEASATMIQVTPENLKPLSSNLIRIPLAENIDQALYTSINRKLPTNDISEKSGLPEIKEMYGELPPRPVGPIPEPDAIPSQPVIPVPLQPNPIPIQPVSSMSMQPVGSVPIQPVNPIPAESAGLSPGPVQPVSQGAVPILTPPPLSPVAPNFIVPLSEIPPTDGPLLRGSKVALYFGNVFLQLVSQFLRNARSQISLLKSSASPPPVLASN